MRRTIVAVACSIIALAAYGSTAQACISCEYVPEVVKSGERSGSSYQAKPSKRVREYSEQRERRSSKKRVTERESAPSKSKSKSSTASAPSKAAVSTASVAAPAEAENEHSAITTSSTSIANQVKAAITPEPRGPQNENSTISTAVVRADEPESVKPVEHATADKNLGCKKYFPSTGLTLSVPCE
jgi:hypothetical protein